MGVFKMVKKRIYCVMFLLVINLFCGSFAYAGNLGTNNPPNPPEITGPKSGIIGEEYIFNIILTDPDENDIMKNLEVDFGDEIIYENCGCGQSWRNGTTLEILHKWEESGMYQISARVQDVDLTWSNWSEPIAFLVTNELGYIDITVEEAWELLKDTSNGIQIPIDVRTDSEWAEEHIDTSSPENSKHHCLCELENQTTLQEFISLYEGEEIIVYCRSGARSVSASNMFVDNGFVGIIYNMVGGINAWKDAGFPTVPNLPPEKPTITGTTTGKPEELYNFTISTNDPEGDIVYYYVNWSDNTSILQIGPFASDEEVIISHFWLEKGSYIVKVKAKDYYQDESDWGTLEVSMPKNKAINSPFFNFLQNHPHMFPLLRQLLGL